MNEMSESRLEFWEKLIVEHSPEYVLDGSMDGVESRELLQLIDEIRRLRSELASGIHLQEVDLEGEIEDGHYLCIVDFPHSLPEDLKPSIEYYGHKTGKGGAR